MAPAAPGTRVQSSSSAPFTCTSVTSSEAGTSNSTPKIPARSTPSCAWKRTSIPSGRRPTRFPTAAETRGASASTAAVTAPGRDGWRQPKALPGVAPLSGSGSAARSTCTRPGVARGSTFTPSAARSRRKPVSRSSFSIPTRGSGISAGSSFTGRSSPTFSAQLSFAGSRSETTMRSPFALRSHVRIPLPST